MSLLDIVRTVGTLPANDSPQALKKRYSEILSGRLARELAEGLRGIGFAGVKPTKNGVGEKEFQGGLGSKKVDVSFSDERHGLLLAISIKSINFAPFGKNLKNRFGDLLTESITLHLRFPYSVVCMFFAFPAAANGDKSHGRDQSTFHRATRLFATVSGRKEYTDPGEKFEHVTMMLYHPGDATTHEPWVKLFDAQSGREITEEQYYETLRQIYNNRNPHAAIGEMELSSDDEPGG